MMACYLDTYIGRPIVRRDILQIRQILFNAPKRPVNNGYAHVVWKWWLEREFPTEFSFKYDNTSDEGTALRRITKSIDSNFPIIASTNHSKTRGHIILVVGYILQKSRSVSISHPWDTVFVCHDPFGDKEGLWGSKRLQGAACLAHQEGEDGSGRAVEYDVDGIRRLLDSPATFYFLRPENVNMSGG